MKAAVPAVDAPGSFCSLGVTDWLVSTCKKLGMAAPTQVQAACIPAILAGRSVIGSSQTGSGKTAAFALPILQLLGSDPFGVFALVLTPTRELAFQLAEHFRALGSGIELRVCVVVGGLDVQAQSQELSRRPHIVIATPGRLRAHLTQHEGLEFGFSRTRFLVFDEADRLLEATFETELRTIVQALPQRRQTLLFSATITPSLASLHATALPHAFTFRAHESMQTPSRMRQEYVFVPAKVKEVYLFYLLARLQEMSVRSAIIFASTCKGAHLLGYLLEGLGLQAAALHSQLNQHDRLSALHRFKSGLVPILLATDLASRGLDVPTVDLVVNFDLPTAPNDYVHRVGRTARADTGGWSVVLVTQYDVELVQQIENAVGVTFQPYLVPEKDVLTTITQVFSAKRAAAMRVAQEEAPRMSHPHLSYDARTRKRQRKPALAGSV